jgi:hypothetical protein
MDFDPYQQWLGIPEDRRPPTPHDLLGVPEDENDEQAIYLAGMARYDQIRTYAASPDRAVAEHAQNLLGEIALALSGLMREAAGPEAAPEGPEASRSRLVQAVLCKSAAVHVGEIPPSILGLAISLFGDRFDGDRRYLAAVQAREPETTALFTERACYHLTERSHREFLLADVERCTGTRQGNRWLLYVQLAGQPKQKLLLGKIHLFMAMRKLFNTMGELNADWTA